MDRFIDSVYGIDKDVEKDLKSNMDRFIVKLYYIYKSYKRNLKSNMDRFIDTFNFESLKKIKI